MSEIFSHPMPFHAHDPKKSASKFNLFEGKSWAKCFHVNSNMSSTCKQLGIEKFHVSTCSLPKTTNDFTYVSRSRNFLAVLAQQNLHTKCFPMFAFIMTLSSCAFIIIILKTIVSWRKREAIRMEDMSDLLLFIIFLLFIFHCSR